MKKLIVSVLLIGMMLSQSAFAAESSHFSDVPSNASYAEAVNTLADMGILNGDKAGRFNPDKTITRAEAAVIICKIAGVADEAAKIKKSSFSDVPSNYWAVGYIAKANELGIISGYSKTKFGPKDPVTCQQMLKMLICVWGWGEITLDTLIICSITAFTIIITGSYFQSDATSGALTTIAFGMAYGHVGAKLTAIAIAVFAWTTIIGMYYTCEKSVNYAFGDTERNKKAIPIYIIYYMLPCVIFYNIEADVLWALTDILSACYVALTIFFIYAKHKVIFALFDDFWKRFLPAKERGENPPVVSFDCAL